MHIPFRRLSKFSNTNQLRRCKTGFQSSECTRRLKRKRKMADINKTITLWNGMEMPRISLGTWKSPPAKTKNAILTAIRSGYRFIDCANDYDNEHIIGDALRELYAEGTVKRSDLFIQAKLWNSNHRPEHVEADLDATLKDLQTDYVDSFVIHWPMACPSTGKNVTLRTNGIYPAHHSQSIHFQVSFTQI